MPKRRTCWENADIMPQWPIRLYQDGRDNFAVQYGQQLDERLSYGQATAKLGQAIMHALACAGELDNG